MRTPVESDGTNRGRSRLRARSRGLAVSSLFVAMIAFAALWIGRRENGPFLTCAPEAVSVSGLADTFQKRPALEPWLASWRNSEGNAASQYALALEALATDRTAEPSMLLDSVLPHLERGSRMRLSAFTDSVYPIAADLVSTELADLSAFSLLLDALRERASVLLSNGNLDGAERHEESATHFGHHFGHREKCRFGHATLVTPEQS